MYEGYNKDDLRSISKQGNRFFRLAEFWKKKGNQIKSNHYYKEYARMTTLGYSLHYNTPSESS